MFLPVENRHSESSRWSRLVATPILLAAVAAVGGCSMPKAMRVETANHPTHKDEYVRFRTTYYFRVYDYCADVPGAPVRVLANALYRFRMTGKAHSLTSAMRFEAGTLPKDVIDPFGSTVEYDPGLNRFVYRSREDVQEEAKRRARIRAAEDYVGLVERLKAATPAADNVVRSAISAQAAEIAKSELAGAAPALLSTPKPTPDAQTQTPDPAVESCRQLARGFQILGPEGWRLFDQNERLILAMSSSGKPLIGTLQELSGRMLANQPDSPAITISTLEAEGAAERSSVAIADADPAKSPDVLAALQSAIESLSPQVVSP